jgi:competence protein ComEA
MAQLTLPPLPGPNKPAAPEPTAWPRSAQLTAAFLLGIVLTLLIVQGLSLLRPGSRPADLEAVGVVYRIDLNRASRAELLQIPGFGPQLVERIESHRRDHGPFHSVDDLLEVQGFGPTTVQRVRPWVCVAPEVEAAPEAVAPPAVKARPAADKAAHASAKKEGPAGLLDPNRATFEELQRLPGIGPKMAQRIVDERARKAFRSVDELRRVSGIGAKTLEKLRPYFQIGEPGSQMTTLNAEQ